MTMGGIVDATQIGASRAWRFWAPVMVALLFGFPEATICAQAQTYPALTGRVVDEANVIPAASRATIEPKLADLETKSGIQLVVATIKSLGNGDIETYAN